jgi:hypothetical protein
MDSRFLASVVRPDGTLDDRLVEQREVLYEGRNGKKVERFFVRSAQGQDLQSFIFKPQTNKDTVGREAWIYEYVLPDLPLRYPQLLMHADHEDAERYWSIYEDLGSLNHRLDEQGMVAAAEAAVLWHRMPLDRVPEHYHGHTPYVNDVSQVVEDNVERLAFILRQLDVPETAIAGLAQAPERLGGAFPREIVVSHGDFYTGNIAVKDGQLVVLDWEYMHRNSVYWDLYNLLDITSPKYRKPPIDVVTRQRVLQAYIENRKEYGWVVDEAAFIEGYYGYVAIYTAWILLLIDKDLRSGMFERTALLAQQSECRHILSDCISSGGWEGEAR